MEPQIEKTKVMIVEGNTSYKQASAEGMEKRSVQSENEFERSRT
jgi:hypothetical protein